MYTLHEEMKLTDEAVRHVHIVEKLSETGNIFIHYQNQLHPCTYTNSLENLPYFIETQKTIMMTADTKLSAYRLMKSIMAEYREFIQG